MIKPPKPPLSPSQRIQRAAGELLKNGIVEAAKVVERTGGVLRDTDARLGITERIQDSAADVDRLLHVSKKANSVSEAVRGAASAGKRMANEHKVARLFTEHVAKPIRRTVNSVLSSEAAHGMSSAGESIYGTTRQFVVNVFAPDLPTYDSHELLQATKRELNYIAACILQVSSEESSQLGTQFSRAVTAKVAGTAGTAALLGLVATFGHAGTGAAIAGLSGAAATSATMAWIGSLVGGGVAAGAALTGGLAFVIGLGAYKALASEQRTFELLSELEQRIVQSCWMLAAVADAYQKQPDEFTPEAAGTFLEEMLVPLYRDLSANMNALCQQLDGKNAIALRQHVLADFQSAVIARLGRYLSWAHSDAGRAWHGSVVAAKQVRQMAARPTFDTSAEFVAVLRAGLVETAIGGAFAALLSREPLDGSTENRLVLDALRRSSPDLRDASQEQLGNYLRSQSTEELRGTASNVKGIYHELWYVEQYNANHENTYARVFGTTNQPGADVQIVDADTGEVQREIQLKAVELSAALDGHFERYPLIHVVATDEVAAKINDARVDASGVANAQLESDVASHFDDLREHTVGARAADTALLALGIVSSVELMQMLRGERRFPEAVINTASKVGVAAGATALTALLFG